MLSVPAVELASAQVPPASVIVTVCPVVEPVAVQLVNPVGNVMAGVAGRPKPEANVTEMVLPTANLPLDEVVKPSVQVVLAPAVWEAPVKLTAVGVVAEIVIAEGGLAAVTS